MSEHIYIAIDLKSFYASVECCERNMDPLRTNLVVADAERTEKTICLAVSPSLKSFGISGRARLFEVVQRVKEVNKERLRKTPKGYFEGKSCDIEELMADPSLEVGYHVAPPRMAKYLEESTRIYDIYLKYIAPEDIHVYSIDEVFMDVTHYLGIYKCSPAELARRIINDVLQSTGITATAGVAPNLYLCKIAMDIVAKHMEPDENGVRVAYLDEMLYRKLLWSHRPITDFWRVGAGYRKKLEENGLYTMGDIARCSLGQANDFHNEELLYRLFGINAELLIDHAWGWEPVTIEDIKAYKPSSNSTSSGQVLQCPYSSDKARIVVMEMTDLLVLDLVDKGLVTDQLVLTVGYDIDNLKEDKTGRHYDGEVKLDRYGRKIPKHAHGTTNLKSFSSSSRLIIDAVLKLYDEIVDKNLSIRRINVTANHLIKENEVKEENSYEQMSLFTDYGIADKEKEAEKEQLTREKKMQRAILDVKKRYGKNALLRGVDLEEGATAISRNKQIGGHKA